MCIHQVHRKICAKFLCAYNCLTFFIAEGNFGFAALLLDKKEAYCFIDLARNLVNGHCNLSAIWFGFRKSLRALFCDVNVSPAVFFYPFFFTCVLYQVHIDSGHGEVHSPTTKESVDFFSKQENDLKLSASISEPVPIGNGDGRGKPGTLHCHYHRSYCCC